MSRFRPSDNEQLPVARPDSLNRRAPVATVPPVRRPAFPPAQVTPIAFQQPRIVAAPPVNATHNLALLFSLGFIFVSFSFAHEVIGVTLGIRSFLPWLFGIPAFFGFLFCGGLPTLWRGATARLFIAYSLWLIVTVFFSSWPGGSFTLLRTYFQTAFIPFLLVGGLVVTLRDFRRLLYVIAAAGLFNELTGRYLGSTDDGGRMFLRTDMSIGNSNDFAAHLILLLPILWFAIRSKAMPFILRVACVAAIPYGLYLILRTGSRGALVGLGALYLCVLLLMKGSQRVLGAFALPLIGILVLAAVPSAVSSRLNTVFSKDNSIGNEEAYESKLGREYLFRRSLELTVQHPLLGVGPGEFYNVEGEQAAAKGRRGNWMQTHNSYTQISSEAGIPAAILLIICLAVGLKNCIRIRREAYRRQNQDLASAASVVIMGVVGFCAAAFFLSLAYRFYFPVIAGMLTALPAIAQAQFSASNSSSPA